MVQRKNEYIIRLKGESLETALDSEVGTFESQEEAISYAHDELPHGAEFFLYDLDLKAEVYQGKIIKDSSNVQ
jgi:hypothetical protein